MTTHATSDVSAAVLTIGEPFTRRALASLASQTLPPQEVILVRHVSPVFRAMNEAARRVRTPFFVQVDADMVLDPTCLETLRAAVRPDTGIAVGELRDPLLGQVVGVKLFRTACFRHAAFPDSITPDTDFGATIRRLGWKTEYVGRTTGRPETRAHTFGEHCPEYTPAYTYRKYILEGCRLRYRGARHGLLWQFGRLEESPHPQAALAQIALAHGFFLATDRDQLTPLADTPDAARLVALLASDRRCEGVAAGLLPLDQYRRLRDVFRRFTRAGHTLARAHAGATCQDTLASLSGLRPTWSALVAKVAFGHGLLTPEQGGDQLTADEHTLRTFVTLGLGRRVGPWHSLRAHLVRHAGQLRRPRGTIPW